MDEAERTGVVVVVVVVVLILLLLLRLTLLDEDEGDAILAVAREEATFIILIPPFFVRVINK